VCAYYKECKKRKILLKFKPKILGVQKALHFVAKRFFSYDKPKWASICYVSDIVLVLDTKQRQIGIENFKI
jgi:hypothetical protein